MRDTKQKMEMVNGEDVERSKMDTETYTDHIVACVDVYLEGTMRQYATPRQDEIMTRLLMGRVSTRRETCRLLDTLTAQAVVRAQELDLTRSMPRLRLFTECLQAPTAGAETRATTVGMVVAAETETEIVVAQDLETEVVAAQNLETPIEEDPTVGIESTTVDESQIVVGTGAPLTEGARGLAAEAVTGLIMRLATVQMQLHCAPILDRCPRQPSPLLATTQLPEYADPSYSITARCAHCSISSQVQSQHIRAPGIVGPHARGPVATWLEER
jgi:hypothetical protein